ncbi:MAG: hypothetical protein UIM53_05125 [Acutalibacteraceae bacterium]|nr:hypothetical protein [Acutalibacteraceae bacterium]
MSNSLLYRFILNKFLSTKIVPVYAVTALTVTSSGNLYVCGSLINVGAKKIIEKYFVKDAVLKTCKGFALDPQAFEKA